MDASIFDSFTVSGKVISSTVNKGTSKTGSEWQNKVFAIESTENGSTKQMAFELFGESRINQNPFRTGQNVEVTFTIECRQWQDKWFTSLSAQTVTPISSKKPTKKEADPYELPF